MQIEKIPNPRSNFFPKIEPATYHRLCAGLTRRRAGLDEPEARRRVVGARAMRNGRCHRAARRPRVHRGGGRARWRGGRQQRRLSPPVNMVFFPSVLAVFWWFKWRSRGESKEKEAACCILDRSEQRTAAGETAGRGEDEGCRCRSCWAAVQAGGRK
jgi:hypothetical protein